MKEIIGDYEEFYQELATKLQRLGIDVTKFGVSHLGYKTATIDSYERQKKSVLPHCKAYIENEHNGRLIFKGILRKPLQLKDRHTVNMIEIMPPKPDKTYPNGLEHIGFVVGSDLPEFIQKHQSHISEIQDQGQFCRPAVVLLGDKRVKFYETTLKDAIEKEGNHFVQLN